jgi:glycosyltransferase involved in cell wall biosynthesis
MKSLSPRVSVCLPVYNGEKYVGESIQSVLNQTFDDLELIISDNASVDQTSEICKEFASKDSRVRYSRLKNNCGLAKNHNRAFMEAAGQYLMWVGHDDVLAKEYIRKCIEPLEKNSDVVICFSNTSYVDEKGTLLRRIDQENPGIAETTSKRFQCTLYAHIGEVAYGLMKRETVKQTGLHQSFANSDRVLIAEMALRGRFSLIPDCLFARRVHPEKVTMTRDLRTRTLIFDPSRRGDILVPELELFTALWGAINHAELPLLERLLCYKHLLGWIHLRRNTLWKDLKLGLKLKTKQ